MNQQKVYLHVGLQKTASTYLQDKVFPNMSGISYVGRPYTQVNKAFNSLQYADDSLYSSDTLSRELQLIRQDAGAKPVLISDELFSGYAFYGMINRGMVAKRLAELIPESEVILFLRGQVDLVESLYNQYVKTGLTSCDMGPSFLYKPGNGFSYQEWKDGERRWRYKNRAFQHWYPFSTSHFLYSNLLSMYESLFNKVHVFLYEDFKHNPAETLKRLEHILSLKIAYDPSSEREQVNVRLQDNDIKLKIAENRLASLFPSQSKRRLRQFLARPLSFFISTQTETERRKYVADVLRDEGIFQDNKILDETKHLGMEKYADQYFVGR